MSVGVPVGEEVPEVMPALDADAPAVRGGVGVPVGATAVPLGKAPKVGDAAGAAGGVALSVGPPLGETPAGACASSVGVPVGVSVALGVALGVPVVEGAASPPGAGDTEAVQEAKGFNRLPQKTGRAGGEGNAEGVSLADGVPLGGAPLPLGEGVAVRETLGAMTPLGGRVPVALG